MDLETRIKEAWSKVPVGKMVSLYDVAVECVFNETTEEIHEEVLIFFLEKLGGKRQKGARFYRETWGGPLKSDSVWSWNGKIHPSRYYYLKVS